MPKLTITEFARELEKARTPRGSNLYGVRGTTELPARGYGLIKRKKRKKRGIKIE